MKTQFLAFALLLTTGQAFAGQVFNLPEGSLALEPIAGKVTSIVPLCPLAQNSCFVTGQMVTLSFNLGGCMDQLAPVTYQVVQSEDRMRADLYVSAQRIINEASRNTRCFVAPTAQKTISLIGIYGELTVHFLESKAD